MARSSYIYLVPKAGYDPDLMPLLKFMDVFQGVAAAFTVKWEAFKYCRTNGLRRRLYRLPDGGRAHMPDGPLGEWIENKDEM